MSQWKSITNCVSNNIQTSPRAGIDFYYVPCFANLVLQEIDYRYMNWIETIQGPLGGRDQWGRLINYEFS